MRALTLAAALAAALLVAACGGDDGTRATAGGDSREQRFEQAQLRFAQCMRENGIDVEDPGENGLMRVGPSEAGERPNPDAFRRAEDKCRRHLEGAGQPPELSEEDQREFEQRALAFARCMREQGVDIPDPQVSEGGGIQQRLPEGADPGDPRFREAEAKCREHAPGPPGVEQAP